MMHKILLVEDSSDAAQLVHRALGRPLQIEWVRTIREASTRLEKQKYDLLLLDAHLPDGAVPLLNDFDCISGLHFWPRNVFSKA